MKKITTILMTGGLFIGLLFFPALLLANEAIVLSVSGNVRTKKETDTQWTAVREKQSLTSGQQIHTQTRASRIKIQLADNSRLDVGPNTILNLENLRRDAPSIKIFLGKLRAKISKVRRTKFEIKTPVAVCAVRGTELAIEVDEAGNTGVDVYEGIVAIAKNDTPGKEMLVSEGEHLDVFKDRPLSPQNKGELDQDSKVVKNEVGLDMSKEQVQAAAAAEMRLAEYQEGKTLIDVFGKRVRLAEYIMRPAADTFKLVVLNERDDRFDYFYYRGQFNKDLPADLSVALKQITGQVDSPPEYYLKNYETGRSNTQDKIQEIASGGHLVDINNNSVTSDDITSIYDPGSDTIIDITGRKYYQSVFDTYEYKINDIKKMYYTETNLSSPDLANWKYAGETMQTAMEWPSGEDFFHQRISNFYGNGTWEKWDNYIISDEGKIAPQSAFSGQTTGTAYKKELVNWNYQQVITASEFAGRKIDLVVEPKIMIESGLIK